MAHLHSVYDSDMHFSINAATRVIRNESDKKSLVQYDHNSERFTFELPRYIEEHDMSLCDKIEVHYINIGKGVNNEDVYEVNDLQISPDDDGVVIFSWLVSQNATMYAGTLNFLIRFTCLTGAVIDYAWHTEIFSGITVSNGMNNGEAVIEEYSDVLEAWRQELFDSVPTVKVEQTEDGAVITATDKNGTTTATISGGGGLAMELLWENAAIDDDFRSQSINISNRDYSKYLIEFTTHHQAYTAEGIITYLYLDATALAGTYEFTPDMETFYRDRDVAAQAMVITDTNTMCYRNVTYGYYSFLFGTAHWIDGSDKNSYLKPARIYGIA